MSSHSDRESILSKDARTSSSRSGWRPSLAIVVAILAGLGAADSMPRLVVVLALVGVAVAAFGGGVTFCSGEWLVTVLGLPNVGIAVGALRDGAIDGAVGPALAAIPVLALYVGAGVAVGMAWDQRDRSVAEDRYASIQGTN